MCRKPKIKNKESSHTHLAEVLAMFLQQTKADPFETLLMITTPITNSVIKHYYFRLYEYDDLRQEASLVLLRAIEEFRIEEGMPFIYFYRKKLLNKMNMLVRRERANKRTIDTEAYSLEEAASTIGDYICGESCDMTNPESRTIINDVYDDYLVELSPFEHEVFLQYMQGNRPNDIAIELGYKEIQVRNALYRCSIKLKAVIQK